MHCTAKASHNFSAKNKTLDFMCTGRLKKFFTKDFVKLRMLRTIGPRYAMDDCPNIKISLFLLKAFFCLIKSVCALKLFFLFKPISQVHLILNKWQPNALIIQRS